MTKSNLPKAQISFTPDNELMIKYPKPTLEERLFSIENIGRTIIAIVMLIMFLILFFSGVDTQFTSVTFALAITLGLSIGKVEGTHQIKFYSEGLAFVNYKDKVEKHSVDNTSFIDFKIKIIDNSVELNIDKHIITFNDVKKLPLVTESIAKTWNLTYYDTISVDDNYQILTYKSNLLTDEKVNSLIAIDENDLTLTFRDTLSSPKFFTVEKMTGKLFSHQLGQGVNAYLKLTKDDAIDIEMITNIGVESKCQIRVDVIDIDGQIRTIFESDKRYEDETVTTYRDVELIYDTLKALPILENVVIEKVFR